MPNKGDEEIRAIILRRSDTHIRQALRDLYRLELPESEIQSFVASCCDEVRAEFQKGN